MSTDMIFTKTTIVPCYCSDDCLNTQSDKDTKQHNNPTIAAKYSLEVLFRSSDNIPHHYTANEIHSEYGLFALNKTYSEQISSEIFFDFVILIQKLL